MPFWASFTAPWIESYSQSFSWRWSDARFGPWKRLDALLRVAAQTTSAGPVVRYSGNAP